LAQAASASAPEVDTVSNASGGAAGQPLRDELDELLAAECAFCGELAVR